MIILGSVLSSNVRKLPVYCQFSKLPSVYGLFERIKRFNWRKRNSLRVLGSISSELGICGLRFWSCSSESYFWAALNMKRTYFWARPIKKPTSCQIHLIENARFQNNRLCPALHLINHITKVFSSKHTLMYDVWIHQI